MVMEIVNYRATVRQPDGSDHETLWQTRELAESYTSSLTGWPSRVEEQRFDIEVGTTITVRNSHVEVTGEVRQVATNRRTRTPYFRVYSPTRVQWWNVWEVVGVKSSE